MSGKLRSRVLTAMVIFALVLAIPAVPAGAVERQGDRGSADRMSGLSDKRADMREMLEASGIERPEPGEVSALAADDDIPGVPVETGSQLPWPILFEDLDAATDPWDVYRVTAYPGDQISFYADPNPLGAPTPTLDIGVALWDASATGVVWPPSGALQADPLDGIAWGPDTPVWICYTVPEGAPSTTYYVGVYAFAGSGPVDYQWGVTSRADGNIPGVALPPSGHRGVVDFIDDQEDVYAVNLGEGQKLEVTVSVVSGANVDFALYGPGTADVWGATPEVDFITAGPTNNLSYTVDPGESGVYYIDVYGGFSSYYTLDWEVSGVNVPGPPLPASGTTVSLSDGSNVGHVDLRAGETFSVSVPDPDGDLTVSLFAPAATDVGADPDLVTSVVAANPKVVTYTVPQGKGGRYYVNVENNTLAPLDRAITWSRKTNPVRLAGTGRYDTAVLVSQRDFFGGADTVVIASGEGFADALSAAGLAGAYDAPVLLVPKATLPAAVRAEIVRLGATRAIVVGGTAVVTDAVKNAIDAIPGMTTPRRIAGSNRYDTSALVADAVFTKCGWTDWRGMAAMARGDAFADALALAPLSWAAKMPILLTATNSLPVPIDARLPSAGPTELPIFGVLFAGGTSAISNAVYSYVDKMVVDLNTGETIEVYRLAGTSRYETASKIAAYSADTGLLSYASVGIATGANFPDALGGGAGIAKSGGVLLMTEPNRLTGFAASALSANKTKTHEVQVFGGTGAVGVTAFNAIKGMY